MYRSLIIAILLSPCVCEAARGDGTVVFSGEKRRNNLVAELLEVAAISKSGNSFEFARSGEEWIFISAAYKFTCDNTDLTDPQKKELQQANKFIGSVVLEGAEVDTKRSFMEMYSSNPESRIPVWITYHWTIFKALGPTAKLTVSDWPADKESTSTFGQEQTFNFVEIEPYRE